MRQIGVVGVSDTTYIGSNQSEYTLMLIREDGERFVLPLRLDEGEMAHFLQFVFADSGQGPEQAPAAMPESEPTPQLEHYGELDEVEHSFAALDGEEDDEGPLGDIDSI
jgi:hypothetical protein